jgi:hypothetical protein
MCLYNPSHPWTSGPRTKKGFAGKVLQRNALRNCIIFFEILQIGYEPLVEPPLCSYVQTHQAQTQGAGKW